MFTRERHRRGVFYFGPYANAKKVRETLDVLNRVFQFRPCEGPKPGRHSGIPCLDYHIERCHAPCVGYISKEDYRGIVDGRDRLPLRRHEADRARAASGRCARRRPTSASRRRPATGTGSSRSSTWPSGRRRTGGDRHDRRDRDRSRGRPGGRAGVPAPRRQDDRPARLPPRERRGPGRDDGPRGVLRSSTTAPRRRSRRRSSCRRRRRARSAGRSSSRSGAARGSRCACPSAARSGGSPSSPPQNARVALASDLLVSEQKRLRRVEALEELREALNLECLPLRIECFDISNIQGESVVGSMVVFQDAIAKKAHYRKFARPRARRPGRLRRDGGGRLAPLRAAARRHGGRLRRGLRGDAEPRRDRRRQGPALGRAGGDAGATTCRAWR